MALIELRDVTKSYKRDAIDIPVLENVSITVDAGDFMGLMGPSGSGKSTLLNLLMRFYDPQEGRVLVGGFDVRDLDPSWLRGQIATVMQEPVLFSRTVAENIRYGLPSADDHAVETAASWASALEFIGGLRGGFDASIGDRGVQLSGGQRQRLAIARALLRRVTPEEHLQRPGPAMEDVPPWEFESTIQQLGDLVQLHEDFPKLMPKLARTLQLDGDRARGAPAARRCRWPATLRGRNGATTA
jgi:ABC-type lipoprotein export system ATPase subunit